MDGTCSQTADVLQAESGYVLESDVVEEFRRAVDHGQWEAVEDALGELGVSEDDATQVCSCAMGRVRASSALKLTDVAPHLDCSASDTSAEVP